MSKNIITMNIPAEAEEKYVPSEKVAGLKKTYRNAQLISIDYRKAENDLRGAIRALKLAKFDTSFLEAELVLVQERRNLARVIREEAAAAYHTAKAEEAK